MRFIRYIVLILFMGLLSLAAFSQHGEVYSHEATGVRITSAIDWHQVVHDNSRQIFELENRNHNLNLHIWKVRSELTAREYLGKWICEQGMTAEGDPYLTNVDGILATTLCAVCSEMRRPYKNLLLAMPLDSGLLILHFKCPVDCYPEHREQMEALISSISLGKMVQQGSYYAHRRSS